MIKISKRFWPNPAEIDVSGISCSASNIIKILNILNCKWIMVTVDSLTEESRTLAFIKNQELKYFARSPSPEFMEVSVIIPHALLEPFFNIAVDEYPENLFVYSLPDAASGAICLQHSYEELVATGRIDLFISISLDERVLMLCMNSSLISPRDVYTKIKTLLLHHQQ